MGLRRADLAGEAPEEGEVLLAHGNDHGDLCVTPEGGFRGRRGLPGRGGRARQGARRALVPGREALLPVPAKGRLAAVPCCSLLLLCVADVRRLQLLREHARGRVEDGPRLLLLLLLGVLLS